MNKTGMDNDNMKFRFKVIAVDVDGTLCKGVCWSKKECMEAIPDKEMIGNVNSLYDQNNFIVIYTSRRNDLIPETLDWLRRNNVRFHAISNNKMPADVYIDDSAICVADIAKKNIKKNRKYTQISRVEIKHL